MNRSVLLCVFLLTSCSDLELDPPKEIIHARFDPDAKVIPMPTDILRDAEAGRLDLPADDEDLTDAEREFYAYLNTMDAWSTTMAATVELTAPIDPATITPETVQVWHWRGVPQRVDDARVTVSPDETKLTIDAPREGWERGGTYVVVMRGGASGVEGRRGEQVECDAAFYFLRQTEVLNTPEHERAFPGDTRDERAQNADDLEEIRADLTPYFDYFANNGLPRAEVAALWSFTVTERTELAMDKASQRMPLPIDLLIDPATGRVDLPPAPWDSDVEVEAKHRLAEYDGFGTSAHLLFGFTGPMDPATINSQTVKLYELGEPPLPVPAEVVLMDDLTHVIVIPETMPLREQTSYGVVVHDGVRDAAGQPVVAMPLGHLMKAHAPVFVDGASQIDAVDDADAVKVENVRTELAGLLDHVGRDGVLAAWPFTTMTLASPLEDAVATATTLQIDPDPNPANVQQVTPGQALADFALAIGSLFWVGEVYHGTIKSPVFLDDRTRSWREDGGYEVQEIAFTMTVPRSAVKGEPLKVIIFGHGIMTERRFVLAVGDALAQRGYAAIAIDFPMHGTRTHCLHGGPLSLINPTTGELTSMEPCANGTTCAEDGRCVDALGNGNEVARWPIIGMPVASGAAFIEIEHIANTRDHFKQTLVDLGALTRSLKHGDWEAAIGYPIDPSWLGYAGQSLGGIIGASFVPLAPEIDVAVLNVPGADTVDLFSDSTFFGPHVDAFFTREEVELGSFEAERFMNVARWFMDAVDPQGVAHRMTQGGRRGLIQMATLDFIIPNEYTFKLEEVSGLPRVDYVGEHAFLAIPIEPAYLPGVNDMAEFFTGEFQP